MDTKNKSNLTCQLYEGGKIAAIDKRELRGNLRIQTVAVGRPDGTFVGDVTLTGPGKSSLELAVDSRNLGDNSIAGVAAAVGKQVLQKCWGKVGPSI